MKPETLSFAVLAICAALVCSTNAADAQTGLRPLTAQWWQCVLSIPADNNPTLDTTGQDCMVGQQGPIWFLTGANFGGETPLDALMLDAGGRLCFLSGDKCFLLQHAKLLARAGKLDRQVHARTDRAFYQFSTQHVGYGRRQPGQTPPCRFDAVSGRHPG